MSAQISVGGVADKTTYNDRVTFTITNLAGYYYDAHLNGAPVQVGSPVTVSRGGYQELRVYATNATTQAVTSKLIRFSVLSPERAGSENGLPPWTPSLVIPSASPEFQGGTIRLVTPSAFPAGLPLPVIAWIEDTNGHRLPVNGSLAVAGQAGISIKRGVGSGFLTVTNPGLFSCDAGIGGLQAAKQIDLEAGTAWTPVSSALPPDASWPAQARIHVTGHLTNAAGSTLTIGPGTVVRINPGVDIHNQGRIVIQGTVADPVVFLPAVAGSPWGGFIQHANNSTLSATGAIFTASGANQGCWFTGHDCSSSLSGIASHRGEQALISLKGANCNLSLVDSAAINLAGQFGHSAGDVSGSYDVTLTRFLLQRATTGGEYTDARFTVNDSALIECPDDSRTFANGDNDALYIVNGTHGFTNVLFGWVKDDAVDSGGSGAGRLDYQDCWFEAAFHEANALSGTGKIVNHYGSVFLDCSQGLETGYDGPVGTLQHCLALGNLVGARFGDNYDWTYTGSLRVTNSLLLNNLHDVWGMTWNDWLYRTNQMNVRSNWLAAPDPLWPENLVYDPATDGWRLAAFSGGSPGAGVGAGFALATNNFSLADLASGIPVRLSRFSSIPVSLGWVIEAPSGLLASGSLTFVPGQMEQRFMAAITNPDSHEFISIRLRGLGGTEITGLSQIFRVRPPQSSVPFTLVSAGAVWRFLDTGTNFAGVPWTGLAYPDSNWASGPAQLGFGDGDEKTLVGQNGQITTYFRHCFVVEDPSGHTNLTLALLRDDGGMVYLNGPEVFRSNIRAGAVDYTTLATNALAQDETTLFYTNTVPATALVAGTNVLAVEIHQSAAASSDLSFDLQLYANLPPAPLCLKQGRLGTQLVFYWDDPHALLQEAPTPAGPWATTPTANPHVVIPIGERYHRLVR